MNAPYIQTAIGPRDGDYIRLENQWARVYITRIKPDDESPVSYEIRGDLKEPREHVNSFATLREALEYAWQSLAVYQEGRA